ncbi:hypothetical protein, partial [Acinetobacter indicus]|uniref:hypothetical protein n=2 Tax=Acinetobacter indicus TaxID=756892 RepID=UPI001C0A10C9
SKQRKATSNGCLTSTFNFGYLWEDYRGMPIAELRHLTGRIGELYVAMMTLGQLADSVNQRGYDVVSSTGRLCCTKIS